MTQTVNPEATSQAASQKSDLYFGDLYGGLLTAGLYAGAIKNIQEFIQYLQSKTIVVQTVLNNLIQKLVSQYVRAKIAKQNEVVEKIKKLQNDGGEVSQKSAASLSALQTEYSKIGAESDPKIQALQSTSQGITDNTQTLSGDSSNGIKSLEALIDLYRVNIN